MEVADESLPMVAIYLVCILGWGIAFCMQTIFAASATIIINIDICTWNEYAIRYNMNL